MCDPIERDSPPARRYVIAQAPQPRAMRRHALVVDYPRGFFMENAATDRATPTTVNSSVRTREYLTAREIERLMDAARKSSRWGHRSATATACGRPSCAICNGDEIRALRRLQREQGPSSHVFMTERDGPMTPKAFHALFGWIGARATHFIGGAGHAGGVRTRLFRHSRARMFSGCGSLQQPPGFQFLVPLLVYKSTSLCL
jgi:hypothetical protein